MNQPIASVIVVTYNEAERLKQCIESVIRQTCPDWELIVVDDGSKDRTADAVAAFQDARIRYIRNATNLGEPASRNAGIEAATTDLIFFVDADCVAAPDWLDRGLAAFAATGAAAVEGKLIFVARDYRPAYSDRVVSNPTGGQYMTANMAYRKSALIEAGLFDARLRRYCDRDMALRVKRCGRIVFEPAMVVTHVRVRWTPRSYFDYARAVYYTVLIYKKNPQDQAEHRIRGRVYAPEKLLAIVFPPLVLLTLLTAKFRTRQDFLLLALLYPRLVYERLVLWKYSLREKVFLI